MDDRILTFDPDEKDKARAFVERGFMPPGTKRYKDKRFMFDRVFDGETRQEGVYAATAKPLLSGLLDGYNATVFAYGVRYSTRSDAVLLVIALQATGCGKTHTISGTEADPGIIYLTMADLFQRIEDRRDDWNTEVVVTFLEIYNEEIRDLLADAGTPTPRGGLQIREDKVVKVIGLVELRPTSAEEVKQIVLQGNSRRTQSPTHANETSSRSHAVLQVHVTQSPRTASLTEQRTVATLSIIDLAGSERAAATSNMGQRMVEGANINKSLLALGNCINALCESGGATRHIPYRNSKLTRLLKFSLGGNCKTVMAVCIAPTSQHFDDTHNTLLYAERATKIKTKVVTRNVVNVERHVGRYVEAINRLNIEVAELKAKLAGKICTENDIARRKRAEADTEVGRAKQDMQARMEQTRASIIDGASCAGKISAAEDKLFAIRARVAQIDALTPSPDLEAERALLQALAGPEEQAIKSDSSLCARLTRSQNSRNIFEATLRAVSERRSDRLEESSIENVKADAKWRKAEMDRVQAEAERDAFKESFHSQAELVVTLLGMIGRCTVVLKGASCALKTAMEDGKDGFEGVVKAIATSLSVTAGKNDDGLAALIGQTTAMYVAHSGGISVEGIANQSALQSFTRVASSSALRPVSKSSRRSSYNNIASPRKAYKSPRKSLRSSVGQPYRRVSDKEKKVVQWRDEAGKGDLDDAGQKENPPIISIISSDSAESIGRSHSVAGSESEWEDERTDDSLNLSFVAVPNATSSTLPSSSRLSLNLRSSTCRRPRPSRLDPGFLKTQGATSLGCLQESEENDSPVRRVPPLSDRSMNHSAVNDDDASILHIPKKGEHGDSPSRRVPTSTPRLGASSAKGIRRRSNVGPMRSERMRRRSSMIPQPSPIADEIPETGGPRRVETIGRSPAKRPKRLSLLGNASKSLRVKGPNVLSSVATLTVPGADPNVSISADTSMRFLHSKPTWR